MMLSRPLFAFTLFALAACAAPEGALPDKYQGPTASLIETYKQHSKVEADFFVVEKINGRTVQNSLTATRDANYGKGLHMKVQGVKHDVPVGLLKVKLTGRSAYGAPILAMMYRTYEVTGETSFVAQAGKIYTVKGELGPRRSAVWVEDELGNAVGSKIEKLGN